DGCDFACTFCLTTQARGPSRSLLPGEVLRQGRALAAAGYREVVLTGVHLGAYGHDLPIRINLAELLRRLLRVEGLERVRLSSVEPREFTEELIRVVTASQGGRPRVCRHFHIPLQHGSDRILRAMGRNYTASLYARRMRLLRRLLPDSAAGADVMVGFPGEGEEEFEECYAFLRSLPLTYLHVFPYSPRPGTRAAEMGEAPPPAVKRRRAALLRALDREKRAAFRRSQLGREVEALIEARRDRDTGLLVGMTENYLRVMVEGPNSWMGASVPLRLDAPSGGMDALRGVPLS
ncbi:MAG: MiaB/RimO family radical SAM methylthiotransferase, partial [Nitrospinota bacterium]